MIAHTWIKNRTNCTERSHIALKSPPAQKIYLVNRILFLRTTLNWAALRRFSECEV